MDGSGDFFTVLAQDHARFEGRLQALLHAAEALSRTGSNDAARDVIVGTLDFFATEGAQHEEIEEATLFPRIRALPQFQQILSALEFQHRMNRAEGAQLRACLDRVMPGSSGDLRRLALRFVEMHRAHALGEERALFPLAASVLSPATIEDMSREARQRNPAARRTEEQAR
jgi:hemerythrin-like domain-containing protein